MSQLLANATTQAMSTARILSDEEREAKEREEDRVAAIRHARQHWIELCGVRGRRYAHCRLENYEIREDGQKAVVESLRDYAKAMPDRIRAGQGIVLYGPSGTGKDHLAWAMVRVAATHCFKSAWANGVTLFADRRDGIDSSQTERQFVAMYSRPDVLLLSDPIPPRDQLTNAQQQLLYRILDARYSDKRPTWVTLNVATRRETDEKITTQISERLIDGALTLECSWASYRKAAPKDTAQAAQRP